MKKIFLKELPEDFFLSSNIDRQCELICRLLALKEKQNLRVRFCFKRSIRYDRDYHVFYKSPFDLEIVKIELTPFKILNRGDL